MNSPEKIESFEGLSRDTLSSDIASNIAQMLADEEWIGPNQFSPKKAIFEKFYLQIEQNIQKYKEGLKKGALAIFRTIPEIDNGEYQEEATQLRSLVELIVNHREQFIEELSQDKSIQEIAQISDASLEKMYKAAKYLYDNGRFQEAADAFNFLTLLNSQKVAFWYGLANSAYQLKNYKEALMAYTLVCQLVPDDYFCHIFSSRCYEALGDVKNAINSLELAQYVLGDREGELKQQIDDQIKKLGGAQW